MKKTALSLPSILDLLTPRELGTANFVKPAIGVEVVLLNRKDTGLSPASQIMSVNQLTLAGNWATPVHIQKKEKLYVHVWGGLLVLVVRDGKKDRFILSRHGDTVVVPPNTPHAVMGLNPKSTSPNRVYVIASSNDPYIVWEQDADQLCLNQLPE